MAEIYALLDQYGMPRYVGQAKDAAKRLKRHMSDRLRRNTPLYAWIRKHGEPEMIVLEADVADPDAREVWWIAAMRLNGAPLLNLAKGGCDIPQTKEGRAKAAVAFPAAKRAANARAMNSRMEGDPALKRLTMMKRYIGKALRGGWVSDDTKGKLRLAASKRPDLFGVWSDI